MSPETQKHIEIASLAVGVVGLLYVLFHHQNVAVSGAGSSVPVLLGSGGDSGGSGLSATSGDDGATTLAPITIPALPALPANSIYAPNMVTSILGALGNPNGGGCCGQNQDVPYNSVPAVIPQPLPDITDPSVGYTVAAEPAWHNYQFGETFGPGFDDANPLGFG